MHSASFWGSLPFAWSPYAIQSFNRWLNSLGDYRRKQAKTISIGNEVKQKSFKTFLIIIIKIK
jgi:hypothetical protein